MSNPLITDLTERAHGVESDLSPAPGENSDAFFLRPCSIHAGADEGNPLDRCQLSHLLSRRLVALRAKLLSEY